MSVSEKRPHCPPSRFEKRLHSRATRAATLQLTSTLLHSRNLKSPLCLHAFERWSELLQLRAQYALSKNPGLNPNAGTEIKDLLLSADYRFHRWTCMLFALSSKRREAASTAEEEEEEAVEFDLVMNAAWGNYVDLILARNGMRGMELEELARVVEEGGQERRDLWEKGAKREFWKVTPGKVLGLVGWTLPVAVVERAADNLKKKWARR